MDINNCNVGNQNEQGNTPAAFDPNKCICPVKKLPIFNEDAKRVAAIALLSEKIEKLNQQLKELPKKDFIDIGDHILLPTDPSVHFLLMDVRNVPYDIHDSYQQYKYCTRSKSKKALPSDYKWRLCEEDELKLLKKTSTWDDILAVIYGEANAITLGDITAPRRYFSTERNTYGLFDSSLHDKVMDLYISDIPRDINGMEWVLEKSKTRLKEEYHDLVVFYQEKLIHVLSSNDRYMLAVNQEELERTAERAACGELQNVGSLFFMEEDIQKILTSGLSKTSALEEQIFAKRVLEQDTVRADMTPYVPRLLDDPNGGSWELWGPDMSARLYLKTEKTYYARDPRQDIQKDGIIGIDFGTKSTVVVCKEGNEVARPLRIGMGRFEKEPAASDYENPTVMEFCDIDSFRQDYSATIGRPFTKWADICISHTAFGAWKENENTEDYFSFFNDLKQWAGDPRRQVRIRDKKGAEINLSPYEMLNDGDFDPIEIYAYYIGLYINNMHTKHIYLKYLLSFPVTYTKSVREKILESFKKGLAQSLPATVRTDADCMEKFQVQEGAGEPAAYAVCALQEYKLMPVADEKIIYGVFDFGGGTTDFDFGIWRKASGAKERRYRYVIHHFGDGGDAYLGGENLLELLAFEVFKANSSVLRKSKITFPLPPQCQHFGGDEVLISESQEAWTNMRHMMECLRPFWERQEGYEKLFETGVMKLRLFDSSGTKLENFELAVDTKILESTLRKRITEGVESFFDALFSLIHGKYGEELKDIKMVHIFLAGNSSKSEILREIFRDECEKYSSELRRETEDEDEDEEYFKIYAPLGTKEADEMIGAGEREDIARPTGKTGVAMGLVQCSKNSQIKVINDKSEQIDGEIRFKYWVGYFDEDSGEYFQTYLRRNSAYQAWVEYLDAGVNEFDLYYTSDPSAEIPKHLLIDSASVKKKILEFPEDAANEDSMVYIRPISPNEIEYVVASSLEDASAGRYKFEPIKVALG